MPALGNRLSPGEVGGQLLTREELDRLGKAHLYYATVFEEHQT